jgi:hypothetical protein
MSNLETDDTPVNNVAPILSPDIEAMSAHLHLLFGRATEGKIEITGLGPDRRVRTRFFATDQTDDAAEFGALINRDPGCNVYVGAALRKDEVFPGSAADDGDFLKTYVLWADADNEQQVNSARDAYRSAGVAPPFVVVTGRTPSKRAQMWWPLESPITDIDALRGLLKGMAVVLGSDPKVCTGKQLMRLAGTLAWPKPGKEGRVLERTEFVAVENTQREFMTEQLVRAFPPVERSVSGDIADITVAPAGALGLTDQIMDGREGYAFRLVRATLRELLGTTGCEPTADELYRAAAPVYFSRTDQVRPGRGPEFLKQKCQEAIRAFREGVIPGASTLDEAVVSWAQKRQAEPPDVALSDEDTSPPEDPPFRASTLHGEAPERQWVVPDWIVQGSVNSLYGDGGLGKTLLAQQLACSVSLGVPWLGLPTARGSVLAVLCEDDKGELHRRHNDIKSAMGYGVGNPFSDVWLWPRVGSENILLNWDTEAKAGKFAASLERTINEIQPSLLILDTLADFYGANEIDRVQVNYFVKTMLGGLIKRSAWPLTVLLLGHPSVRGKESEDGFSGSTAWNNAVRSRMYLTKPKDGDSNDRILTRSKANYSASGEETGLKLTYENGVLRAQEAFDPADEILWACVRCVVDEVKNAWDFGRPLTSAKAHDRNIYRVLLDKISLPPYTRDMVKKAILTAIDDGQIDIGKSHDKRGYKPTLTR